MSSVGTKREGKQKNKPQTLCEVRNQTMWVNKLYGNAQEETQGQTEGHDGLMRKEKNVKSWVSVLGVSDPSPSAYVRIRTHGPSAGVSGAVRRNGRNNSCVQAV